MLLRVQSKSDPFPFFWLFLLLLLIFAVGSIFVDTLLGWSKRCTTDQHHIAAL